jgi:hypothetical protein
MPSSPLLPTPPGTRIAAPFVPAGSPEAPMFLRITLAADALHTVMAFERSGRSCAFAFLPCQIFR